MINSNNAPAYRELTEQAHLAVIELNSAPAIHLRITEPDDISTVILRTDATNISCTYFIEAEQTIQHQQIYLPQLIDHTSKPLQRRMISQETLSFQAELDSHADTCAVNDSALILDYTNTIVDVGSFSGDFHLEGIPIVKADVAYDDITTGETFVLVLGQALFFGPKSKNILLNPNQMRSNGLVVDDIPIYLSPKHRTSTHSIYFLKEGVRIPLSLDGCISFINIRTPTLDEVSNCKILSVTSHDIPWDPRSPTFMEQRNISEPIDLISREEMPNGTIHFTSEIDYSYLSESQEDFQESNNEDQADTLNVDVPPELMQVDPIELLARELAFIKERGYLNANHSCIIHDQL